MTPDPQSAKHPAPQCASKTRTSQISVGVVSESPGRDRRPRASRCRRPASGRGWASPRTRWQNCCGDATGTSLMPTSTTRARKRRACARTHLPDRFRAVPVRSTRSSPHPRATSADRRGGARRILGLIVVAFISLVIVCGDNSVSQRVVAGNKPLVEMPAWSGQFPA